MTLKSKSNVRFPDVKSTDEESQKVFSELFKELFGSFKNVYDDLTNTASFVYTTTAPNGSLTKDQGTIALYNNSGTFTVWINTDGATTWQEVGAGSTYTLVADVGTFTRDRATASSTQQVSHALGVAPVLFLFFSTVGGTNKASWGFDNLSINGQMQTPENEGVPVAGTYQASIGQGGSIFSVDDSSNNYGGYVSAVSTTTFTITWTKTGTPTGSISNMYLCLGLSAT